MAFDLATAKSVGFDLATAKPVEQSISEGPGEIVAALGSGMLAAPVSGIAGLFQGAKNLVSPGMPAGDRVRQVQEALTYQPRGGFARGVVGGISYPFEKFAGMADAAGGRVAEATGSPAVGAAVNTAIQGAPMLAGKILQKPAQTALTNAEARATAAKNMNSAKDAYWAAAKDEGYVVPPSAVRGSIVGSAVEGVAGKAALSQEAALRNQQVTNKIGRREAGLADDAPITEGTLDAARQTMLGPYREVAALSTRAATAIEEMKIARREAKGWWQHYNKELHPDSLKKAQSFDTKAAMYEKLIEHEATRTGRAGLLAELREARVKLAKNYDVERALNVGSTDLDARIWGRMLDKGKPLSGGLETAARFSEGFNSLLTRESSGVPAPGVSKVNHLAAPLFAMAGHSVFGPAGIAAAGLPYLGAPARALMLSDIMQPTRQYQPSVVYRAGANLANPQTGALFPMLGAEEQR